MKPQLDRRSPVRKPGKALRRRFTRIVRASFSKPAPITATDVADAQRVVLIRPNFRPGNTAIIACFAPITPGRTSPSSAPKTLGVVAAQPMDEVFAMSRKT